MYTVNETYKNIEAEFKPRSKWGPWREGYRAGIA